jgi:hypothetical protein
MSLLSYRPAVLRLTAAAGLMSATFLFAPFAASADPMATQHPMRHASSQARMETVEQRITRLHTELRITPSEEVSWTAVAQVMRDNEARMQGMISARAAEPTHDLDAVEDLKTYERFTQAHVDGLKMLISSFETLYNTMPVDQKHLADQVFQKFGHRRDVAGMTARHSAG